MKKKLILIYFIALVNISFAQTYSQKPALNIPTFTIHSPNAASLGQYGEYPTNLSTGVPPILIPLYTVSGSKLQLPLSLSYHAGGIKVDQESSQVGLGWAFNAGGVITRVVRDKPDERTNGYLTNGKVLPDYNLITTGFLAGAGKIGNNSDLEIAASTKDGQPDLFTINAPGLTGDFCLNNSGKFVSTNLDSLNYNVDLNNNVIIITDKKGNVFRFGQNLLKEPAFETTETTYSSLTTTVGSIDFIQPNNQTDRQYTSSWYLTEMISSDGADTISFKYKTEYYTNWRLNSMSRFVLNDGASLSFIDALGRGFDGNTKSFIANTIYNSQVLDKVIFKNGFIQINALNDRKDLQKSNSRINGFIVSTKDSIQLQKIVFDNSDYFLRTGEGATVGLYNPQDYQKKSLKLNGVKFYGANNSFINGYGFEYDATPLPPTNTTPQDFWGYYNGRNNSSLIPTTFYSSSYSGQLSYIGENRNSDYNYMKAGVLKKIKYPGGGYSVYDYEPHYYLNKKEQEGKVEATQRIGFFAVNRLPTCSPTFLKDVPQNNVMEFEVTEDLGGERIGKLYVMFTDYKNANGLPMTFKITNLTTNSQSYYFEHGFSEKGDRKVVNQDITIRKGDKYRLEASTNGVTGSNLSMCNSPYIEVGLSYTYWQATTSPAKITVEQAGGLRVKSIANFDSNDSPTGKKTYEYGSTKSGPNAVGIGTLITDPSNNNFYNSPMLYAVDPKIQVLKNVLWFTSNNQAELGLNRGIPVFYDKITEDVVSYNDNSIANGKTEYFFRDIKVYYEPRSNYAYPYPFMKYSSWDTREVNKIIHYKMVDNIYTPVKSIEYEYDQAVEKRIKTLVINNFQVENKDAHYDEAPFGQTGNWIYTPNPNRFQYYNFYVSCGKVYPVKEITNEYVNGVVSLTSEKNFQYNKYFDLSKESGTSSNGALLENRYKYSADLNYPNLISKNIISLPVQSEELINGNVKGGTVLKYNDFGALTEQYSFKGKTPVSPVDYGDVNVIPTYYEKKTDLSYDLTRKNIKQLTQRDSKKSYLWSYNDQFIIAEINNADYTDIEKTLTKSSIDNFSLQNPNKTAVDKFISPLRTALPNAQIITYSYNPLVGVTSKTDAKGLTIYYEYDEFQRLKNVKDQNGNIIKRNTYNYKN